MALCQESVYNLIPLAQFVPEKPPRHKSKYPGKLDEHALVYPMGVPKLRNSHKTFGVPEGHNSKHPSEFTRAHTGTAVLSDPKPPTHPKTKLKDNTPTRKDKPVMNLKSGKNFLTANAVEAILSHPKSVKQDLPYTMKPDFGKVPKYIARNKAKVATEQAQVEEYLRLRDSEDVTSGMSQLSAEERVQLIAHLKTKWSSVNTAYQKMTFTLDTPTKRTRKETYEQQLAEIEKDIQTLERGEVILVVED